ELVDGGDAVRLPTGFRTARAPDRGLERIVRVDVRLDEIELELRRNDRLPAALRIQLEHVTQYVARRHRHAAAVRIEAVLNGLRGRPGGPGHPAHGLRVRLQHDVDLGGTHRITRVGRVVTRHGLQEDAFGQSHAFVFCEFFRGHDFAAGDAGHVGDDGFYF